MEGMLLEPRTPVEVWAPAFSWERPERLFTPQRILDMRIERGPHAGGCYCLLCEGIVANTHRERHARAHRREAETFQKRRARQTERENARRLRQMNRARAESERAYSRAAS
jgi:hypothetical protein